MFIAVVISTIIAIYLFAGYMAQQQSRKTKFKLDRECLLHDRECIKELELNHYSQEFVGILIGISLICSIYITYNVYFIL